MYASFLRESKRMAAEEATRATASTSTQSPPSSPGAPLNKAFGASSPPRPREVPPLPIAPSPPSPPSPAPLLLEPSRVEATASAKPLAMMPPTLAPLPGRGSSRLPPVASASHVQTMFGQGGVFTISSAPSEASGVITQQPLLATDGVPLNNNNHGGLHSGKGQRYNGSAKLARLASSSGSRKGGDEPTRVSSAGGDEDDGDEDGKYPIRRKQVGRRLRPGFLVPRCFILFFSFFLIFIHYCMCVLLHRFIIFVVAAVVTVTTTYK